MPDDEYGHTPLKPVPSHKNDDYQHNNNGRTLLVGDISKQKEISSGNVSTALRANRSCKVGTSTSAVLAPETAKIDVSFNYSEKVCRGRDKTLPRKP